MVFNVWFRRMGQPLRFDNVEIMEVELDIFFARSTRFVVQKLTRLLEVDGRVYLKHERK